MNAKLTHCFNIRLRVIPYRDSFDCECLLQKLIVLVGDGTNAQLQRKFVTNVVQLDECKDKVPIQ